MMGGRAVTDGRPVLLVRSSRCSPLVPAATTSIASSSLDCQSALISSSTGELDGCRCDRGARGFAVKSRRGTNEGDGGSASDRLTYGGGWPKGTVVGIWGISIVGFWGCFRGMDAVAERGIRGTGGTGGGVGGDGKWPCDDFRRTPVRVRSESPGGGVDVL